MELSTLTPQTKECTVVSKYSIIFWFYCFVFFTITQIFDWRMNLSVNPARVSPASVSPAREVRHSVIIKLTTDQRKTAILYLVS